MVLLFAALLALPGAAQTLSVGSNVSTTCNSSYNRQGQTVTTCFFNISPGMIVTISGSGFAVTDTSVGFSGNQAFQLLAPCPINNGSFSCKFLITDGAGISGGSFTATGEPAGDTATASFENNAGFGIYPTSGPPGTLVHVYGSGYVGWSDTGTTITFSGTAGTPPIVKSVQKPVGSAPPASQGCLPQGGGLFGATLNDIAPCLIRVPKIRPGYYTVGVGVQSVFVFPDVGACDHPWCGAGFTVISPSLSAFPPEAEPGATITLNGSNFSPFDQTVVAWLDQTSQVCPVVSSNSGDSFTCSFTLPSNLGPGRHYIYANGVGLGDGAVGYVDIPGPQPLSPEALQGEPGQTLQISGISYQPSDVSADLVITGTNYHQDVTPASGCAISYGAFNCPVTLPPDIVAGTYTLTVTGYGAADADSASLTVVPTLAMNPGNPPEGATVVLNSAGLPGSSATASLNGAPLQLVSIDTAHNNATTPVSSCPVSLGSLATSGVLCGFIVPPTAVTGANQIVLTDDTGVHVTGSFTLLPSIVVTPAPAIYNQGVTILGYGFPPGQEVSFDQTSAATVAACVASATGSFSCPETLKPLYTGRPYTLEAYAFTAGIAQQQVTATTAFSIAPELGLSPGPYTAGEPIQVALSGLDPSDRSLELYLDSNPLPLTGSQPCLSNQINTLPPVWSLSCTTTIPSVTPGVHTLRAVGNNMGESNETSITVAGITISPGAGTPQSTTEITGFGFSANDTSRSGSHRHGWHF